MLPSPAIERLRAWVEQGGVLISEGCPGYWDEVGHVAPVQPARGLDTLFGAREQHVEFTPDILGDLTFEIDGRQVPGGIFLQTYAPTTGSAAGRYRDGAGRYAEGGVAVVDNEIGRGRTRLIGTFPGYGHFHRPSEDSRAFFAGLACWAGVKAHTRVSTPSVVARLHASDAARFLWVLNHGREPLDVTVGIGECWEPFRSAQPRWGNAPTSVNGRQVTLAIDGRDAAVLELR